MAFVSDNHVNEPDGTWTIGAASNSGIQVDNSTKVPSANLSLVLTASGEQVFTFTPPAGTGSGIYITPGSGSFTVGGHTYNIDAAGDAMEDGKLIDGGSNTGSMALVNGLVYGQDATTKNWFTWNQTTWSAASAPPSGTTPQSTTTTLITPGSGSFTVGGHTYSIDSAGNAREDGDLINGGSNTGSMALGSNGLVYGQDATTKDWYTWDQTNWNASSAPPVTGGGEAFTANVQLSIANQTGHTIDGFALDLANGTFSNINAASFGGNLGFFNADSSFATINGTPSQMAVLGQLASGATTTGSFVLNSNGSFTLGVTPDIPAPGTGSNAAVTVSSGDGDWTITPSADATIAAVNGPAVGLMPSAKLVIDLTSAGTDTIKFLAPPTSEQVDSIGFTAAFEVDVVNDTGKALSNLVLQLTNSDPSLPLNLVPAIIHYGITLQPDDPNYAFFSNLDATSFGGHPTLLDPTGNATTASGPAASQIVVGSLAAGGTSSGNVFLHNTELTDHDNSFTLKVVAS